MTVIARLGLSEAEETDDAPSVYELRHVLFARDEEGIQLVRQAAAAVNCEVEQPDQEQLLDDPHEYWGDPHPLGEAAYVNRVHLVDLRQWRPMVSGIMLSGWLISLLADGDGEARTELVDQLDQLRARLMRVSDADWRDFRLNLGAHHSADHGQIANVIDEAFGTEANA